METRTCEGCEHEARGTFRDSGREDGPAYILDDRGGLLARRDENGGWLCRACLRAPRPGQEPRPDPIVEPRETPEAAAYRSAFGHVVVEPSGRWSCYVTGLSAPCGCFACNASARDGCARAEAAKKGGSREDAR